VSAVGDLKSYAAIFGGAAILLIAALVGVWTVPVLRVVDPADPQVTLADVERTVAMRYPTAEVTAVGLSAILGRSDTVVFDVREPAEHAQSHIPGARRIDPGMTAAAFMAAHGREIDGKHVVFYCAVGVRSGMMAKRVEAAALGAGAAEIANLRGGIFRWHAVGGQLVHAAGSATSVHPYDAAWGKVLDRVLADAPAPLASVPPS
jgi:rhodanese-related sulfurtransferase